jgi:hypothetical protein
MSKNWNDFYDIEKGLCHFRTIYLGKGKFTMVDEEDYSKLKKYKWYCTASGYARRSIWKNGKTTYQYMHRFIMNIQDDDIFIDHVNHDILDNRKHNLRLCTWAENHRNRKLMKGYTSKYKGVYRSKCAKKWVAQITLNQKKYYLGLFDNEIEAARVYDEAAIWLHKEFALTNFERSSYE